MTHKNNGVVSPRLWHVKHVKKYVMLTLLALLPFAAIWSFGIYSNNHKKPSPELALSEYQQRDKKVRLTIRNHPVDVLVGQSQRLASIKNPKFGVVPLDGCTKLPTAPAVGDSHLGFEENSFAYLLSLDASSNSIVPCSLDEVIKTYGKPNQTVVIAGSLDKPSELLLYYDNGSNLTVLKNSNPGSKTNTILPIPLTELPNTACKTSSTSLNIVAHEDDDLLFLNPAILKNIQAGRCVRTIYITAGDAGQNELYWQSRERASEVAYASMLGSNKIWLHRTVKLSDHQYITIINPKGNHKVSLIFMRLPDGQPNGSGFSATANESLERLENGKVKLLHSVDGQSRYNESELQASLTALINAYKPTDILSQTTFNASKKYPDHSDHMAVGRLAKRANQEYAKHNPGIPIKFYTGYPIRQNPANVSGKELQDKQAAYFAYAALDGAVCKTEVECNKLPIGRYLTRQYFSP